jgi:site-specific recombinase XerD
MEAKTSKKRSTFNLVCYLKKANLLKNGEAPIYMKITVNKQVVILSMRGAIQPDLWSQSKERSKGKDKVAQELNHYVESVKSRLYQIHRDLEIDGKTITAQIIKDTFLGNNTEEKGKTLVAVHAEHNERCRKLIGVEYSLSTIYKFDASLNFLKAFMQSELGREDIPLHQINEDFIRKYELYLKTEREYGNNSAIKHLKILKKVIRIALANDWIQKNPFITIKFRQDEVHVEFLTMEELTAIMDKEIRNKRLSQVRDVFVFCCFTGLAFVDVKSLTKEHIIKGNDGKVWIRKPRQKTNNMCNIPLLQIPQNILAKYEDSKDSKECQSLAKYKDSKECQLKGQLLPVPTKPPFEKVLNSSKSKEQLLPVPTKPLVEKVLNSSKLKEQLLPVPTNQKMNAYLKEIADLCGINKRLTTHCARHPFATSVTLANRVTMENVAKMLGHSSTRMTQHYARILDQSIADDMANVETALANIWNK